MMDERGQTVQDFIIAFTIIVIMITVVFTFTFTFIPTTAISDENIAEQKAESLTTELRDRTLHASPQNGPTTNHVSPECTVAFFTEQNIANCRDMNKSISNITGVSPRTSTSVSLTHMNGSIATVNDITHTDQTVNATTPLRRGDRVDTPRVTRETLVVLNNDTYKITVRIQ